MNKIYAWVWNQAQGCWNVTHEGARRRRRAGSGKGLLVAVASALTIGGLPSAFALPSGETVVSGTADILRYDEQQQMSINQHTDKLILNWNDFSVEGGQTVTFNQPQSTSIALNRVIGANGSNIQGRINANGQVFLINPNGVVFSKSAQVNVGGLVASTQDMKNADFMAGNYKFAGTSTGRMINDGSITAADGGSVALIGRVVNNQGTIKAKNGRIALGAGDGFTVSFDSNNLLDLKVDAAAIDALVSNGGLLKADGGQVLMTAKSAGAMLNTVVNNTGAIEALTLSKKAGKITLDGGDVGVVKVAGSLDASALTAKGDGGVIETKGAITQVERDTRVNTTAGYGQTGTWKISSAEVKVDPVSTPGSNTIHVDTLSRNLATTEIELASSKGDVVVNDAIVWDSGKRLILSSAKDIHLDKNMNGQGDGTQVLLDAKGSIKLNSHVQLSGIFSSLVLNYAGNFVSGTNGRVTLAGKGAMFAANGAEYTVIQNAAQLQAIDNNLQGRYVLGQAIHGNGNLQSIGDGRQAFSGVFEGLGNTISGFAVDTNGTYGGLFARSSGSISNLQLASMRINGAMYVPGASVSVIGGLVGLNSGSIANVSASDFTVDANSHQKNIVGGLVGINSGGTIDHSSMAGLVTGNQFTVAAGGLVGENTHSLVATGSVTNSWANVDVRTPIGVFTMGAAGGMGGLVGVNKGGSIVDSSSFGRVGQDASRDSYSGLSVGGLVGVNQGGRIERSRSSAAVIGYVNGIAGGLVGSNHSGVIRDSEARGVVVGYGSATVGGLVGLNQNSVLFMVKASGSVVGQNDSNIGGLIGKNIESDIQQAEASGGVTGRRGARIGGLIGHNFGGITQNVMASGDVLAGDNSVVGGLVGQNEGRIINALSSGQVRGGRFASLGGLAGLNLGHIAQSSALGRVIVYANIGQNYGSLAGINRGSLTDNKVSSELAQLPLAGINEGVISH